MLGNTNGRYYQPMTRRYPSPYLPNTAVGQSCPLNSGHKPMSAPAPTPVMPETCDGMVVAMAYVPWQTLTTVYEPEQGYSRGTIFPELDKPLMVGGADCG